MTNTKNKPRYRESVALNKDFCGLQISNKYTFSQEKNVAKTHSWDCSESGISHSMLVHVHIMANDMLTLKVLVTTIDAQWEGMGDVGSARYEPALLPHARP